MSLTNTSAWNACVTSASGLDRNSLDRSGIVCQEESKETWFVLVWKKFSSPYTNKVLSASHRPRIHHVTKDMCNIQRIKIRGPRHLNNILYYSFFAFRLDES